MQILTVPLNTPQGDIWQQLVTIRRNAQDFSTLTAQVILFRQDDNGDITALPVTPSATITQVSLGVVRIVLALTPEQTQDLNAGCYAMRLRVEADGWGPYTPIQLNFEIIFDNDTGSGPRACSTTGGAAGTTIYFSEANLQITFAGTAIPGPPGPAFNWSAVPATLSSPGTAGDIAYDSSYLYLCYATNAWMKFVGVA